MTNKDLRTCDDCGFTSNDSDFEFEGEMACPVCDEVISFFCDFCGYIGESGEFEQDGELFCPCCDEYIPEGLDHG